MESIIDLRVKKSLKSGNDSSGGSNTLIHRAKDFGKSLETAGIEGAKLGKIFK